MPKNELNMTDAEFTAYSIEKDFKELRKLLNMVDEVPRIDDPELERIGVAADRVASAVFEYVDEDGDTDAETLFNMVYDASNPLAQLYYVGDWDKSQWDAYNANPDKYVSDILWDSIDGLDACYPKLQKLWDAVNGE